MTQYNNPEDDKFFIARGVKPPERAAHLTEEELEEKFEANRKQRHCEWMQKGPEVYCTTCPQRHGIMVGTQKLLVGTTEEGLPKLRPLVL